MVRDWSDKSVLNRFAQVRPSPNGATGG